MNVIIEYVSQTRLTVKTSSVKFQWFNTAEVYFLVMLPYTGGHKEDGTGSLLCAVIQAFSM